MAKEEIALGAFARIKATGERAPVLGRWEVPELAYLLGGHVGWFAPDEVEDDEVYGARIRAERRANRGEPPAHEIDTLFGAA